MDLEFKPDFEHTRQRLARFWRGEGTRPLLWAVRPKAGVETAHQRGRGMSWTTFLKMH